MIVKDPRSVEEKVRLFRSRFSGLEHVYGTYDPNTGRVWQEKDEIDDAVVLAHLQGKRPLGIYLLTGMHTRALVIDYDVDDPEPPVEFVSRASHYGIDAYVEISKKKGAHVWVLFGPDGVPAAKARAVARHILNEAGHKAEIFPKQDTIDLSRGEYGNFINLPFWGPLAMQGRTVFVDPRNGMRPVPNQWQYLEQMTVVPESVLDEILEVNEITASAPPIPESEPLLAVCLPLPGSLPLCARRMLNEGVTDNQRVACFRLAVQLRKIGLPSDLARAVLLEWAQKNRPAINRRVITEEEVKAQTAMAFLREYHGCGCEEPAIMPFCDAYCPLSEKRRAACDSSRKGRG
jgi:hypothetical protein